MGGEPDSFRLLLPDRLLLGESGRERLDGPEILADHDGSIEEPGRFVLFPDTGGVDAHGEGYLLDGVRVSNTVQNHGFLDDSSVMIARLHHIETEIDQILPHFAGQTINPGGVTHIQLDDVSQQPCRIFQTEWIGAGRGYPLAERPHQDTGHYQDGDEGNVEKQGGGSGRQGGTSTIDRKENGRGGACSAAPEHTSDTANGAAFRQFLLELKNKSSVEGPNSERKLEL